MEAKKPDFKIIHQPLKDYRNHYLIEVYGIDKINTLLDELKPRIREISQEFYMRDIPTSLLSEGRAFIDRHAGNGTIYTISLIID